MPQDFGKKLKWKQDDIKTRVRGDLTAIVWKNKGDTNFMNHIHHPPAESHLCDEYGNVLKPPMVQDRYMGYVDKSDHMKSS
jgi:hypothetical protein